MFDKILINRFFRYLQLLLFPLRFGKTRVYNAYVNGTRRSKTYAINFPKYLKKREYFIFLLIHLYKPKFRILVRLP